MVHRSILPRDGTFVMRLDSQGELQGVRESSVSGYVQTDGIAVAPGGNVAIVGSTPPARTLDPSICRNSRTTQEQRSPAISSPKLLP